MDNRPTSTLAEGTNTDAVVEQAGLEPAGPAYWRQSLPLLLRVASPELHWGSPVWLSRFLQAAAYIISKEITRVP